MYLLTVVVTFILDGKEETRTLTKRMNHVHVAIITGGKYYKTIARSNEVLKVEINVEKA